jgi:LPS-assembly protein
MVPGKELKASGEVELRRGALAVTADEVSVRQDESKASTLRAKGHVTIRQGDAVYSGPELYLQLKDSVGWFDDPQFSFPALGTRGGAARVEFLGSDRLRALGAHYTSCPKQGDAAPAWQLEARQVKLDLQGNEGIAEGAVLRFMGWPLLAAPTLSFPITDERKSGWLPPSFDLDNRSGVVLSVPYYWNIAPHRDATVAPRVLARRGFGADLEFRYLEPAVMKACWPGTSCRTTESPNVAVRHGGSNISVHGTAAQGGSRIQN